MNETLANIAATEILIGAAIMILSIFLARKITKRLDGMQARLWRITITLMGLFLLGYIISAAVLLLHIPIPFEFASGIIFLGGACFVLLIISITRSSIKKLDIQTRELIEANEELEQEISSRIKTEEKLHILSYTDELTGLYNRRGFMAFSEKTLATALRQGQSSVLVYIDINGMKEINDSGGHHAGDMALKETAELLRDTYREADIIGRIGGDEFAVYTIVGQESHEELIIRLNNNLEELNTSRSKNLSLSVGTAVCTPGNECKIEKLLIQADRSMYEDKKDSKSNA
ncbi:GGDEF domain-containing protein [Nitrospirota bacterium]